MSADTDPDVEPLQGHRATRATPWVRRFFGFFGIMTEGEDEDDDSSQE